MYLEPKYEFELVVKKSQVKPDPNEGFYGRSKVEEPEWIEVEKLDFKSLSAKEVLRKIIDYLN